MTATMRAGGPDLATAIRVVVGPALGEDVVVESLVRLKGGYSREMWSFDARSDDGHVRPLILCADMASGVVDDTNSLGRVEEFRLLAELRTEGLPVPAVVCAADGGDAIGRPYLVMDRVEGTASVGPLLRDPYYITRHEQLGRQKADILAAIHAVSPPTEVFDLRTPAGDVAAREVHRWARAVSAVPAAQTSAVRRAVSWLERQAPPLPDNLAVVHGDYRTGNFMYGPDGIRAVLDWEMAHPGDPLEDLAYAQLVCWRIGTPRVGGLVSPDRWIALYERATDRTVNRDTLHFWEVLSAVKMIALTARVSNQLPPGRERALLNRLFGQLNADLDNYLLQAGHPRPGVVE